MVNDHDIAESSNIKHYLSFVLLVLMQ